MKCEKCGKETVVIYITEEGRLCPDCHDELDIRKAKAKKRKRYGRFNKES